MKDNRYAAVAAALPAELPAMTRLEAARLTTLIMRKFWPEGSPQRVFASWSYQEGSVRRAWLSKRPTNRANMYKGLGRLIHDVSHRCFSVHYPSKRAHDPLHAHYEKEIAAFVAGSGWLKRVTRPPKVKAPKPPPAREELLLAEILRVRAAVKRWEAKERRAQTALKKYRRRLRRLTSSSIAGRMMAGSSSSPARPGTESASPE